jgi:hypothetical protein
MKPAADPDLPFWTVLWHDAHGSGVGEVELAEIPHEPTWIITNGYLLREDAIGITIAGEYTENNTYRSRTFIPRAAAVWAGPREAWKRRRKRATAQVSRSRKTQKSAPRTAEGAQAPEAQG